MYNVPFPVSVIRTRMRQEFERHRFVNKLPVIDVLLMQNNAEYQVSAVLGGRCRGSVPSTEHYVWWISASVRPLADLEMLDRR